MRKCFRHSVGGVGADRQFLYLGFQFTVDGAAADNQYLGLAKTFPFLPVLVMCCTLVTGSWRRTGAACRYLPSDVRKVHARSDPALLRVSGQPSSFRQCTGVAYKGELYLSVVNLNNRR